MRHGFLEKIQCPLTGHPLQLEIIEVGIDAEGQSAVRTGILWSDAGHFWYPIVNHVPILLTFITPLSLAFAKEHAERIARLSGALKSPDGSPEIGERSVQTTFTEEWGGLEDDALTFVYDESELVALHRDIWIQQTEAERSVVHTVLDVGCGFGKEAIVLSALIRAYWGISHGVFRPVLSRASSAVRTSVVHIISSIMHQIIRNRGKNQGRWTYANTVHGIRDAFTPMYAHEHEFNEVLEWFDAAGFSSKPQRSLKYRELFGSRLVGVGFIGRRSA